jgi:hypothetical protein
MRTQSNQEKLSDRVVILFSLMLLRFGWSAASPGFSHRSNLAEVFRAAFGGLLSADLARPGCDKLIRDEFVAVGTKEGIGFWLFHRAIIARLAVMSIIINLGRGKCLSLIYFFGNRERGIFPDHQAHMSI